MRGLEQADVFPALRRAGQGYWFPWDTLLVQHSYGSASAPGSPTSRRLIFDQPPRSQVV